MNIKLKQCVIGLVGLLVFGGISLPVSAKLSPHPIVHKKAEKKEVRKSSHRRHKENEQVSRKEEAKSIKLEKKEEKEQVSRSKRLLAWLDRMKKQVGRSQAKHNQLVAVASVRGNSAQDAVPLYWKGSSKGSAISLPELRMFDEALNLAMDGKNRVAQARLESFLRAYPGSPLREDAQQTLDLIRDAGSN